MSILRHISWAIELLQKIWLNLCFLFKRINQYLIIKYNDDDDVYTGSIKRNNMDVDIKNQYHEVPRVKGLPLIGTFFDLIAAGAAPKLHKYIDKRHQQIGPIFRECLGGTQEAVFVSSASLMRTLFLYEGQYPKHPLPTAWTLYNKTHKCQRGLFFMDGAEWWHNRRLLNRFLLNGNLNWMNLHIDACTVKLVNKWKEQAALVDNDNDFEIIDLEQQLYRWAIDVICSIMFGMSAIISPEIEQCLNEFSKIVHKIFESSSLLMNFPPQLAKLLNLKIWTNFEQNVTEVLQKGSEIIEMFVALNAHVEEELISLEEDALFYRLQASNMPLECIKRIFVDLVIAAGDTTAFTSEWALYLLSQNIGVQDKIANEILHENEESLVHGLIKETLRLYPVAPFIGRYLGSNATIGGYRIVKDTLVLLSLYTAGRAAEHFPDPNIVKPERWQRNASTGELLDVHQAHGSLPFAIGNRSCIGRRIALKQISSLLVAVVRNFHLQCNNIKPIESVLRLVTVPSEPLKLAIKLRKTL